MKTSWKRRVSAQAPIRVQNRVLTEGTGVDNDRLRHIRLHERVNELPDPNYATLKYFMGHLHRYISTVLLWCHLDLLKFCCRVAEHESENSMSIQNLAIVFGPTLFKQARPGASGNLNGIADAPLQNKVSVPVFMSVVPHF